MEPLPTNAQARRQLVLMCPDGWTASPNASWPKPCFAIPAARVSFLSCVALCADEGGVPACPSSAEENTFAAGLIGGDWAWLGLYQMNDDDGPAQGWDRCVAGGASGFTSWSVGQPNDRTGAESCAVMTGQGSWLDRPCFAHGLFSALGSARCLCAGPANASSSFAGDLAALQAEWQQFTQAAAATVAAAYPPVTLLAVLPSLLLLGSWVVFFNIKRGAAAADGTSERMSAAMVTPPRRGSEQATVRSLSEARRSAARRRLHVSGAMAQAGWALFLYGLLPLVMLYSGRPIDAVVGANTCWLLLVPPGLYLLLLALTPTDARAVRFFCAVEFAILLALAALFLAQGLAQSDDLAFALGLILPLAVLVLAAAAALAPTLPRPACRSAPVVLQPRLALMRLWSATRFLSCSAGSLLCGLNTAAMATDPALANDPLHSAGLAFGATLVLCALLASPANRGRLHRRLGRLGGRGTKEEEAAAVAALLGGADPATILSHAAGLFRCLRISRLTAEDFAGYGDTTVVSPAELAKKTEAATLGEVTCFLSHSFRDELHAPGAKYEVIARWAQQHEAATGVEPTLWFCKACIDQARSDPAITYTCAPLIADRAPWRTDQHRPVALVPARICVGLPAGARRGGAYLHHAPLGAPLALELVFPRHIASARKPRIARQCVIEIFTFLRMGGAPENIHLKLIADPNLNEAEAFKAVSKDLATFDAAKAQCFLESDKHRLLAVIEAGFGDCRDFNASVQGLFASRIAVRRANHWSMIELSSVLKLEASSMSKSAGGFRLDTSMGKSGSGFSNSASGSVRF